MFDLRPALEAVRGGYLLTARQLEGVSDTLEAVFGAKRVACRRASEGSQASAAGVGGGGSLLFPELAGLAGGIDDKELELLGTIKECIQARDHRQMGKGAALGTQPNPNVVIWATDPCPLTPP